MAKFKSLKPLSASVGVALVASVMSSTTVNAAENPFATSELSTGYMVAAHHEEGGKAMGEGKCGEGKCGDKKAKHEGSCGGDKAMGEGKCGEGKSMREGSCGEGKAKAKGEGKCGEGKCGK